jgi:hypothetical protein
MILSINNAVYNLYVFNVTTYSNGTMRLDSENRLDKIQNSGWVGSVQFFSKPFPTRQTVFHTALLLLLFPCMWK